MQEDEFVKAGLVPSWGPAETTETAALPGEDPVSVQEELLAEHGDSGMTQVEPGAEEDSAEGAKAVTALVAAQAETTVPVCEKIEAEEDVADPTAATEEVLHVHHDGETAADGSDPIPQTLQRPLDFEASMTDFLQMESEVVWEDVETELQDQATDVAPTELCTERVDEAPDVQEAQDDHDEFNAEKWDPADFEADPPQQALDGSGECCDEPVQEHDGLATSQPAEDQAAGGLSEEGTAAAVVDTEGKATWVAEPDAEGGGAAEDAGAEEQVCSSGDVAPGTTADGQGVETEREKDRVPEQDDYVEAGLQGTSADASTEDSEAHDAASPPVEEAAASTELNVGDAIWVISKTGRQRHCTIIEKTEQEIKVHYEGFTVGHDEWLDPTGDRLVGRIPEDDLRKLEVDVAEDMSDISEGSGSKPHEAEVAEESALQTTRSSGLLTDITRIEGRKAGQPREGDDIPSEGSALASRPVSMSMDKPRAKLPRDQGNLGCLTACCDVALLDEECEALPSPASKGTALLDPGDRIDVVWKVMQKTWIRADIARESNRIYPLAVGDEVRVTALIGEDLRVILPAAGWVSLVSPNGEPLVNLAPPEGIVDVEEYPAVNLDEAFLDAVSQGDLRAALVIADDLSKEEAVTPRHAAAARRLLTEGKTEWAEVCLLLDKARFGPGRGASKVLQEAICSNDMDSAQRVLRQPRAELEIVPDIASRYADMVEEFFAEAYKRASRGRIVEGAPTTCMCGMSTCSKCQCRVWEKILRAYSRSPKESIGDRGQRISALRDPAGSSVEVRLSGSHEASGTYAYAGKQLGRPSYSRQTPDSAQSYLIRWQDSGEWYLSTEGHGPGCIQEPIYCAEGGWLPPRTGWTPAVSSTAKLPTMEATVLYAAAAPAEAEPATVATQAAAAPASGAAVAAAASSSVAAAAAERLPPASAKAVVGLRPPPPPAPTAPQVGVLKIPRGLSAPVAGKTAPPSFTVETSAGRIPLRDYLAALTIEPNSPLPALNTTADSSADLGTTGNDEGSKMVETSAGDCPLPMYLATLAEAPSPNEERSGVWSASGTQSEQLRQPHDLYPQAVMSRRRSLPCHALKAVSVDGAASGGGSGGSKEVHTSAGRTTSSEYIATLVT
mmetsp:Transcript_26482/g.61768  ORF Transcript_26482/g.61768 Transcript_26482/m.61768 type:complete len:1125 (-) Transcript_26482:143-3517(-)|eukprot:CAMPEP_0178371200 /NCGR_PEP_ID=MMETSP0689_2-20121128/702_1 /TAXON_ID=160604 /ORGANISM="Amphidinium massartii, Strain CS-259" /LENGTH=1124 /DNA_ID=CAMNT_0019991059 /DNA_START=52 /DNA_END=3426 /DNA_ORIENTATION=-